MIVHLIPFFLVANVSVNDGVWKYGPEAIYNVQIDALARQHDSLSEMASTNSTLKLKCRYKCQVLTCHFQETRHVVTLLKSDKSQVIKDNDDFGQDGPGEDVFELHFDPEGLKDIVVSSSIHPAKLDMLRVLVSQLNIGLNLFDETQTYFDVEESSAVGICNTICDLSFKLADKNDSKKLEDNFYKLYINESINGQFELQEIMKIRNLDKCRYRADYFYSSRTARKDPPDTIETIIKSSISKMTISENKFNSYTENEINVMDKTKLDTKVIIREKFTVSLEDIVPADGPMPEIKNPASASIFPTKWLREDNKS